MRIQNYRFIKSLQLPEGWKEDSPSTGIQSALVRSFSATEDQSTSIHIFYRGFSLEDIDAKTFRQVLSGIPRVIFDQRNTSEADIQLVRDLRYVLGNTGNNQITNKRKGFSGPAFHLERLESMVWNSNTILAAYGWFIDADTEKPLTALCVFFIDASPNEVDCNVEEIYLEAQTQASLLKYMPQFQASLRSIEWSFKS